jgi:hypothetical protein
MTMNGGTPLRADGLMRRRAASGITAVPASVLPYSTDFVPPGREWAGDRP